MKQILFVALILALAIPAMAQGNLPTGTVKTVDVSASIGAYVNLDSSNFDIVFGDLTTGGLLATDTGYVYSFTTNLVSPPDSGKTISVPDIASAVISTNIPLSIAYNTGTPLQNINDTAYTMPISFSTSLGGRANFNTAQPANKWVRGDYDAMTLGYYSPFGPPAVAGSTSAFVYVAPGGTLTMNMRARITRNGVEDLAGSYTQATPASLTLSYSN